MSESKKKILIWETLSSIGGGQRVSLQVAEILKEKYEVVFLIPGEGDLSNSLQALGIKYHLIGDFSLPLGKKNLKAIFKYLSINKRAKKIVSGIIAEERPDLIYCPGPAALPIAAKLGDKHGVPVIWHLHHMFQSRLSLLLLNKASSRRCIKRIIAVSNVVGNQLTKEKVRHKETVIYNFIDQERFANATQDPDIVEYKKKTPLLLAQVAFIQHDKEQLFSLRTLNELKKMGHDATLFFAGNVREEAYKQQLDEYIKDNNLSDNVVFLGRRNDPERVYKSVSTVVVPSMEGLPLVFLESYAAGTSCVVTDKGGAFEAHEHFGLGRSFNDGDPVSAAKAVLDMIASKENEESLALYRNECRQDVFGKRILSVFDEVLE